MKSSGKLLHGFLHLEWVVISSIIVLVVSACQASVDSSPTLSPEQHAATVLPTLTQTATSTPLPTFTLTPVLLSTATQMPTYTPTRRPAPTRTSVPKIPASCIDPNQGSLSYLNMPDGYCLRYPLGFQAGDIYPGIANLYGPIRSSDLQAALGIVIQDAVGVSTLTEAVDDYVDNFLRLFAPPSSVFTRTVTTLGGEPAVLVEGPGEYTTVHDMLTLHGNKLYILHFVPDANEFPAIASDVQELWRTVTESFAFLPESFREAYEGSCAENDSDISKHFDFVTCY